MLEDICIAEVNGGEYFIEVSEDNSLLPSVIIIFQQSIVTQQFLLYEVQLKQMLLVFLIITVKRFGLLQPHFGHPSCIPFCVHDTNFKECLTIQIRV